MRGGRIVAGKASIQLPQELDGVVKGVLGLGQSARRRKLISGCREPRPSAMAQGGYTSAVFTWYSLAAPYMATRAATGEGAMPTWGSIELGRWLPRSRTCKPTSPSFKVSSPTVTCGRRRRWPDRTHTGTQNGRMERSWLDTRGDRGSIAPQANIAWFILLPTPMPAFWMRSPRRSTIRPTSRLGHLYKVGVAPSRPGPTRPMTGDGSMAFPGGRHFSVSRSA